MEVEIAHSRKKNFITFEAVELLILNFCVPSKTFFRLTQERSAAFAHAQITHFKTWSGMANQLVTIFERHFRFSCLRKDIDLETF